MNHVYAILSNECPKGFDDCPCFEDGDCLGELGIEAKILKKIEESMNCAGICSNFEGENEACEQSIADGVASKTKLISAFALTTGSILFIVGISLGALIFISYT